MLTNDFLAECEQRLQDLQEQRKVLDREIEAYERIVVGERARRSAPTMTIPAPSQMSPNGSKINQTQFIRDVIASGAGVTPMELRAIYQQKTGLKPHKSFPYTRLYNMKAQGRVRVGNGKYYPATQEESSVD